MNRFVVAAAVFVLSAGTAGAADVAAGDKVFNKCRQCHRIGSEAANLYGPVLNGVVGRKAGTVPGYAYSEATRWSGIVWTPDALRVYLRQPKAAVAGTNMTFPGLTDPQDIENVIAFLASFDKDGKQAP